MMDEKKKKILAISLVVIIIGSYAAFEISQRVSTKSEDYSSYENVSKERTTESPIDLAKRRNKEALVEAAKDRRVSNLDDFFDGQVDKDPFAVEPDPIDTPSVQEPPKLEAKEASEPQPRVVYVERKQSKEEAPDPEPAPVRRRRSDAGSTVFNSDNQASDSEGDIVVPAGSRRYNAVVHGDQVLQRNQQVVMRVTEDIPYKGQTIPRNSFLNGVVTFNGQRALVQVQSFNIQGRIVLIDKAKLYDKFDGGEGFAAPESVSSEIRGDVLNDVANETIRRTNVPLVSTVQRSTRKAIQERTVSLDDGHKAEIILL